MRPDPVGADLVRCPRSLARDVSERRSRGEPQRFNFEVLGYFIVATFVLCWLGSMILYRARRIDERDAIQLDPVAAHPGSSP